MGRELKELIDMAQWDLNSSTRVNKVRIPYELMTQSDPKVLADLIRNKTMRGSLVLGDKYARNPVHFLQLMTDREKVARKIESCCTIEEARKILMNDYR